MLLWLVRSRVDGHPEVFVYLTLCDGHFRNIYILCVNVRNNAGDNVGTNRQHIQVANMP